MNIFSVISSIVKNTTYFFTKVLKYKNIDSINTVLFNTININMKNKSIAQIRLLGPGQRCIIWSVDDFIQIAMNKEGNKWKEIYDESLFENALDNMINKHDANYGITWETVNYYLENCKR